MKNKTQALQDEYAFLQWHKLWLREELKKADIKQRKIKKELDK